MIVIEHIIIIRKFVRIWWEVISRFQKYMFIFSLIILVTILWSSELTLFHNNLPAPFFLISYKILITMFYFHIAKYLNLKWTKSQHKAFVTTTCSVDTVTHLKLNGNLFLWKFSFGKMYFVRIVPIKYTVPF